MGHHHGHHGGQHHGGSQQRHPITATGPMATWPVAIALCALLFAYGAFDGMMTYRVYVHGEQGMGVVSRVGDNTTVMEVNGHVCAVSGEVGRVGSMVPVAYPPGRQGDCVVHRMSTFRWPLGALFVSAALLVGLWFWRRAGSATTTSPPA